jgi:hypothetical protein
MEHINDLIDELDRDEAEDIFTSECDPDGPFRYTGEFDGWWSALKMVAALGASDEARIRAAIAEVRN